MNPYTFVNYFYDNLPFFSVMMGFISGYLLFNSISFGDESYIGDNQINRFFVCGISLANLVNGLINSNYITKSQFNCLSHIGVCLFLLAFGQELCDYCYDKLTDNGYYEEF